MKKLIIIIPLLALLGGGVAMAILMFDLDEKFLGGELGKEMAAKIEKMSQPGPIKPQLVEIDPIVLPVIRSGEVLALVNIMVRLDVNPDAYEFFRTQQPRVRDRMISALHSWFPKHYVNRTRIPLPAMKAHLEETLLAKYGPERLNEVLVRSVFLSSG